MEPFVAYFEMCLYLTLRYAIFAALLHWYFWKRNPEWTARFRLQPKEFRREEVFREIWSSLRSCLVAAIFMTMFQSRVISATTLVYGDPLAYGWVWLLLSYSFLLVVHDTYFYWTHRLLHGPFLFRLTHRFHHFSRHPSAFAAFSFGTVESFVNFAWIAPLLYLVPLCYWQLHLFSLISLVTDLLGHSGVSTFPATWRKHPWMKWVNTPFHHDLHHQLVKGNFGLYFTFWDRMMGTVVES